MAGTGKVAERAKRTDQLVGRGLLAPVTVEGLRGVRYLPADEQLALRSALTAPAEADPHVAFIAPLDPLLSDRRLMRDLWSFDYIWEVYVPEPKRRWGYYVLPILFGDRLVGRFEPRVDRHSRTLRVLGVWWEQGFDPRRAEGFVDAMRDALRALNVFVGAVKVEWQPATAGAGRLFGSNRVGKESA
jgi:hypothetical protein